MIILKKRALIKLVDTEHEGGRSTKMLIKKHKQVKQAGLVLCYTVFAPQVSYMLKVSRVLRALLLEGIIVSGRPIEQIGKAKSGSEGTVGYSDFESRPFSRVGELVDVIPGLVATQHSGTGKANQLFLRGFNLGHSTDFAAFFEGAPVNFRTPGHGQGYLDLNFIVPELTERLDFRKGSYFSDVGDFSPAATTSFNTYDTSPNNIAKLTIGENNFRRGLLATSFNVYGGDLLNAGETAFYDSPFELDEDLEKYNAFVKYSKSGGDLDWYISLSAYDAKWRKEY